MDVCCKARSSYFFLGWVSTGISLESAEGNCRLPVQARVRADPSIDCRSVFTWEICRNQVIGLKQMAIVTSNFLASIIHSRT